MEDAADLSEQLYRMTAERDAALAKIVVLESDLARLRKKHRKTEKAFDDVIEKRLEEHIDDPGMLFGSGFWEWRYER